MCATSYSVALYGHDEQEQQAVREQDEQQDAERQAHLGSADAEHVEHVLSCDGALACGRKELRTRGCKLAGTRVGSCGGGLASKVDAAELVLCPIQKQSVVELRQDIVTVRHSRRQAN